MERDVLKEASMRSILAVAVLAAVLLPLRGLAADVKAGQTAYDNCKLCHGADGKGNAVIAKALGVTIPTLASKTDDEVRTAIKAGKGKMPPTAVLAAKDIPNLIAYIRTLPK
jgi:mono/diheme cytochrome c family protein